MKTSLKIFGIVLLAALMLTALGCKPKPAPPPEPTYNALPNVIVLLVDTLRADHVGVYGAKQPTPVIDMLAGRGATFTKTYAPSSWTVPSVASLFTGMYPEKHGLTEGVALNGKVLNQQRLPDSYETLAELFKKKGYTTFCVTANSHLDRKFGYNAGFDFFKTFAFANGGAIESTVKEWKGALEKASRTTGYFLYIHWIDPHHPYEPMEPYISEIRPDYMNQIGRTLDDIGPEGLRRLGYFDEEPQALEVMKDLYASEVLWTDASIGRTLQLLPDVGDSMLVFTADHGESFKEHNSMIHGVDLYQETVHVPLILVYPDKKGAGTRIDTPVSLVDLPPTLLAYAGIQAPEAYEGRDLTPLLSGGSLPDRLLFSHLDKAKSFRWKSVFERHLKLAVRYPSDNEILKAKKKGQKAASEKVYLYDLLADPGEKRDLARSRKADAARLKEKLDKEMGRQPLVEPEMVKDTASEELKDVLRTTGYI